MHLTKFLFPLCLPILLLLTLLSGATAQTPSGQKAQLPSFMAPPRVEVQHEGLRRWGEAINTVTSIIQAVPVVRDIITEIAQRLKHRQPAKPDLENLFCRTGKLSDRAVSGERPTLYYSYVYTDAGCQVRAKLDAATFVGGDLAPDTQPQECGVVHSPGTRLVLLYSGASTKSFEDADDVFLGCWNITKISEKVKAPHRLSLVSHS